MRTRKIQQIVAEIQGIMFMCSEFIVDVDVDEFRNSTGVVL